MDIGGQKALSRKIAANLVKPARAALASLENGELSGSQITNLTLSIRMVDIAIAHGIKLTKCPSDVGIMFFDLADSAKKGQFYEYEQATVQRAKQWICGVENQMAHARNDRLLAVIDALTICVGLQK